MAALLPGVVADVPETGTIFSVPVHNGKFWSLSVQANPSSGGTVTGLVIQASLDGENFADTTDEEIFTSDEVAIIQVRYFPGRQVKINYTSGVDSCKAVIT